MSSAVKAELGALFITAKQAAPMCQMLIELGHFQQPTPIQTDNSTAYGIITSKIIPKAVKAMDMQFHWLHNHEQKQQFRYYWWLGKVNYDDYWTKHHVSAHHKHMQTIFLKSATNSMTPQRGNREEWWNYQRTTQHDTNTKHRGHEP